MGLVSSLRHLVTREAGQYRALSGENQTLAAKLAEGDGKLLTEANRATRLKLEIQGHVKSAAVQAHELQLARDANKALQARLTDAEMEGITLRADAKQHAQDAEAEGVRAQAAMGEVQRIRTEHNKAVSAARVQQNEAVSAARQHDEVVCALRADVAASLQLCQAGNEDVDRLSALVRDAQAEKGSLVAKAAAEGQAAADRIKSLQQQLDHDAQAHAESLRATVTEKDALAISLASRQGRVHLLETQAQADAEKTKSLQQQLDHNARAHADTLGASLAKRDALASSLASLQDEVHLLKTLVASVNASLERAESDLAAEKDHVQRLWRDGEVALHSLARHFAAGAAGVPEARWVTFAQAVQNPQTSLADGAAPLLWTLDVWDAEDQPPVVAPDMSELYAALCTDDWSARLLAQVLVVTAALAEADSINTAVISLVVEEAVRSLTALDPATPVACACGLGICQLLAVLHARWPELSVPVADVARRLALPVVDLVVGGDMGPSPDRLDCGPLSLLSGQDSPVGFVVDAECRCIQVVAKTRCRWAGKTSVRIQAPRGPDLTVQIDSDSTFQWLFFHWVC